MEPSSYSWFANTLAQLIRDLGITNGNEGAVGYYVGMMVSGKGAPPIARNADGRYPSAINLLSGSGMHNPALESALRYYWPQTCDPHRPLWYLVVHVLFWPIADVLGSCAKVRWV